MLLHSALRKNMWGSTCMYVGLLEHTKDLFHVWIKKTNTNLRRLTNEINELMEVEGSIISLAKENMKEYIKKKPDANN